MEGFTEPVWGEHPDYDIEVSPTEPIAVWPNPATNVLYLDVVDGITSVFDMTGRMVIQGRYDGQIDVSSLIPGFYTIKVGDYKVRIMKE